MTNTNHKFSDIIPPYHYERYCLKCNRLWHSLYTQAAGSKDRINKDERNIDFVNKVIPCITDEEALIKKALE